MPYSDPAKYKEYQKEYQRRWARENRDKRRGYEKAWNDANREKRREIAKRTRIKDRSKYRAGNTLRRAIAAGKITRGPCEECGVTEDVQGHHEDYSIPLDVIWLCRKHHMERHRTK